MMNDNYEDVQQLMSARILEPPRAMAPWNGKLKWGTNLSIVTQHMTPEQAMMRSTNSQLDHLEAWLDGWKNQVRRERLRRGK